MVEPDRNIHLNSLELNHLYRYNLFINLVIPAQAGMTIDVGVLYRELN